MARPTKVNDTIISDFSDNDEVRVPSAVCYVKAIVVFQSVRSTGTA